MVSFPARWRGTDELTLAFAIANGTTKAALISLSTNNSRYTATHLKPDAQTA